MCIPGIVRLFYCHSLPSGSCFVMLRVVAFDSAVLCTQILSSQTSKHTGRRQWNSRQGYPRQMYLNIYSQATLAFFGTDIGTLVNLSALQITREHTHPHKRALNNNTKSIDCGSRVHITFFYAQYTYFYMHNTRVDYRTQIGTL